MLRENRFGLIQAKHRCAQQHMYDIYHKRHKIKLPCNKIPLCQSCQQGRSFHHKQQGGSYRPKHRAECHQTAKCPLSICLPCRIACQLNRCAQLNQILCRHEHDKRKGNKAIRLKRIDQHCAVSGCRPLRLRCLHTLLHRCYHGIGKRLEFLICLKHTEYDKYSQQQQQLLPLCFPTHTLPSSPSRPALAHTVPNHHNRRKDNNCHRADNTPDAMHGMSISPIFRRAWPQ